jgi:hypothetical protein
VSCAILVHLGCLLISRESMTAQVVLSIAYGIDVLPENDPYVADAEELLGALVVGTNREAALIDSMPWCNCCCVIWKSED